MESFKEKNNETDKQTITLCADSPSVIPSILIYTTRV